jgi:hypothetical protein
VLLTALLVWPVKSTIHESDVNPTGLVQKPFGARQEKRVAAGSVHASESGEGDLFSHLFVPDSGSLTHAGQLGDVAGTTRAIQEVRPAEFRGDVRKLPNVPSFPLEELKLNEPKSNKKPLAGEAPESGSNNSPLAAMPSPIQNFAGLSKTELCPPVTGGQCGAGTPPDTNGDVGPNNYIEAVNSAYAIYSKTGTLQASFTENSLFSGGPTGTLCDTNSFGDPVVVYDQFADRWFLTNFAFVAAGGNQAPPTFQCFAVSKTGNPVTGGWWLYAVQIDTNAVGQPPTGTLGDYPRFGNWNDGCLYMGANGFSSAGAFVGVVFASFSKSAMESGAALSGSNSSLGFLPFPANNIFTPVPSNISGASAAGSVPPANTPNYFVSESQSTFNYEVRKFTPGAGCGTGGTLGAAVNVSQTSYTVPPGDDVPQPNVANLLDSIDDRIMQKVQYRIVGAAESLWVVHDAKVSSTERQQWAQINVTGGTVATAPVQQQIFAPDTTLNRWMGSIAADRLGNVALGYSTSNGTSPNFPSIAYSGRLVGDAANQLPQTETQLFAGLGSQNHNCGGSPCTRWGDYTAMSVDPVDDCTFWYTNEYYDNQTNGDSGAWHTRIGSFKFPTCSGPTAADGNVSGQITDASGAPLSGVTINLSGTMGGETITDATGHYSFDGVETNGFYTVTPARANYTFAPADRSFSLLGVHTDASFTATANGDHANAIDTTEFFVRQQYLDFLFREPDPPGFTGWVNTINNCAAGDTSCDRVHVSEMFYRSPEFQERGYFVYRFYSTAFGCKPDYQEFVPDLARVSGFLTSDQLEAAKTAFIDDFMSRPAFASQYGARNDTAFVDTLMQAAGADLPDRPALIDGLRTGRLTRAQVLRQIAESGEVYQKYYNQAFVVMEYFGYLRRDPDALYLNWIQVLDANPADSRHMVEGFVNSAEYRNRFRQ